ncbi:MAG: SET domain-containing protein [Bacteroidota bacterium]|jgi:SET domain-containing protein
MALIVKKSKIPGAGKGLFTTRPIEKGSRVIEYRGEIIAWKEYSQRVKENKDGYLFFVSRKVCIDAFSTPQYKARYANDALGYVRVKGIKNNSHYETEGEKCFIVATKNINAGEEIYVDYTRDYWKVMKHNLVWEKEQRKKKEAREKRLKAAAEKKKLISSKKQSKSRPKN